MSYDAIARRWARAIFEIGKETSAVSRLEADISAFAQTYSGNEELRGVLDNPLIPNRGPAARRIQPVIDFPGSQ